MGKLQKIVCLIKLTKEKITAAVCLSIIVSNIFSVLGVNGSVSNEADVQYINVTAGYGWKTIRIFTVVDEDVPFDEVDERCKQHGYGRRLDYGHKSTEYVYTLRMLSLNGWSLEKLLSAQFIKPQSKWYQHKNNGRCKLAGALSVINDTSNTPLCSSIGTEYTTDLATFFATSCDIWRPYICLKGTDIDIAVVEYTNMTFLRQSMDFQNFISDKNTTYLCLEALRKDVRGNVAEFIEQEANNESDASGPRYGDCYIGYINVRNLPNSYQIMTTNMPGITLWMKNFTINSDRVEIVRMNNTNFNWTIPTPMPCTVTVEEEIFEETVEAYPGYLSMKSYVIYTDLKTWSEAKISCSDEGGIFSRFSKLHKYQYLKNAALRSGWSQDTQIAVGLYKHENSDEWFSVDSCSLVSVDNVVNEDYTVTQCAMINMTTTNPDEILYASECGIERPYLCIVTIGKANDDVGGYVTYENMVIQTVHSNESTSEIINRNVSVDDCITSSHEGNFKCFAFEYDHVNRTCRMYTLLPDELPVNVTLTEVPENVTAFVKNASRVSFSMNSNTLSSEPTGEENICPQAITTTQSPSHCACECIPVNKTLTQILHEIEVMKKELTVEKTSLSSYVRMKTSAKDDRPSSVTMGSLGIIIMVLIMALILIADFPYILLIIQKCKEKS